MPTVRTQVTIPPPRRVPASYAPPETPRQLATYTPPPPAPDEPRRLTVLGMVIAVIVAAIVAGAVYKGSQHLSATYQATSEFRVSVPNQVGLSDPTFTGENDAATQDAQLVSSAPVLAAAAKSLGLSLANNPLSGQITGTTVGAVNIVQVAANAPSATQANAWAQAAGKAAVAYISKLDQQDANANYNAISRRLGLGPANPRGLIAAQIAALQKDLKTARGEQKAFDRAELQNLVSNSDQASTNLATNVANGVPALQLIPGGDNASQIEPKPKEYAVIGGLAALLVALRVAYVLRIGTRRRRFRRA